MELRAKGNWLQAAKRIVTFMFDFPSRLAPEMH
jgi:hypothetical protein